MATLARRARAGPSPLSHPQERLFLLDRIMPGVPAYNVPRMLRIPAVVDADALGRAFDAVAARHEILRTRIRLQDDAPVQEVVPEVHVELIHEDLRGRDPAAAESEAEALLAGVATRPFALGRDVPLRAALVQLSDTDARLLVVSHHVASDHTSGAILLSELDRFYTAFTEGGEPDLPALEIQYADFAAWQREELAGTLREELLDYWTEHLAGAPPWLDLPADRPRPATQSHRGALVELEVEPALAEGLRAAARGAGVSPFVVLLTAFQVLLHRYTGEEDFVVGVPVSGRHHEETLPLIGYFSNTLALRADLSGDPTFEALLPRVRAAVMGGQIHQELPFELVVEALNPPRSTDRSPIFGVLFGYDVAPESAPVLAGSPIEELPVPGWAFSRFDLSLIMREQPDGGLRGQLEYASDLFDPGTIERLMGHYRTLLAAAVADPGRRVRELDLLTRAEHEELAAINDTARPLADARLEALFAEQAARRPDAPAVLGETASLTYGELEARANRLAHELREQGVATGDLVAVCTERSPDLLVALLGVLKAGAAYVPIDPGYPPERQAYILEQSGAGVFVTHRSVLGGVTIGEARRLELDRDWTRISRRPATAPEVDVDPGQAAYVIYTSGSTGRPKGVAVSHRSVVNLMAQMRREPGLGEDDVVIGLTTPAFDLSVPDWWLPLTTGARLVVVPAEVTQDPDELASRIARFGGTFVQATPTTWQLLIDSGWAGSAALRIVCGGEALPRALADQLVVRAAELWQAYGPTETTVWSSLIRVGAGDGPPPLGGPIDNTTFAVRDRWGGLVPVGVPGELHIGGAGVALGYHGRPDLTAERFVADPAAAGGRAYRTGDLVRWRPGGVLEFLGRADDQVKLRGFRIELGEVEAVLAEHPRVQAAVASVREDTPGDRRLVAYIVPDGEAPGAHDLRLLARSRLPAYMVPAAFVTLDALPVTPNGKLDRRNLPAPGAARPDTGSGFAAPETPVEEALAAIWGDILGMSRVGIDDHFFDLGGHSLTAVAMLARVHEELGVELYLGAVFSAPTIRGLAAAVTEHMLAAAGDEDLEAALAEAERAAG